MTPALRSAATLAVLGLIMVVAAFWGFRAFTEPLPQAQEPDVCVELDVAAGSAVTRDQVVVSVFNGSTRAGLAGATMELLEERGFVAADTGNAPSKTRRTQIIATDKSNPAVQLVRRQFKGARVVGGDELGAGVVVIVGEAYSGLRPKQVESVTAKTDATICAAPGS